MKTMVKLAVGVAIAGALMKLLSKQTSGRRTDARDSLRSDDEPIASGPVEALNESAGTPLSASPVREGRPTDGF
jgi:hypothetical protein